MNSISVKYDLKWEHKTYSYYQLSTCGKLFNIITNRKIKKTVNGRSIGFWIKGKFKPISKLKSEFIPISM